ncbi:ATP-binding protein [Desulfosarcina sp.]|nr:ATP-binding protein [Desulfosarcina sp.]
MKSIRIRLLFVIVFTITLFTVCFMLYGVEHAKRVINYQSNEYGQSLAQGIATACADILEEGNYMNLNKALKTIGRAYETIHSIEIHVAGVPVATYGIKDPELKEGEKKVFGEKTLAHHKVPITVQVKSQAIELGIVHVQYSLDRYYELFFAQINVLMYAGIIFLGIILIIFLFLINYMIVSPVLKIERGTKIIGEGDLEYRIPLRRKDELGQLANAFNDMTAQLKVSKDEIEEWNKTLENKVEKRTHQLQQAHEELKQTQYQLVNSSKMATVGMLGAGVAHELNNPLFCMIGYAHVMLEKMEKGEVTEANMAEFHKYIATIKTESERCGRIVTNLLQFSKKQKMEFAEIDLAKVVENTLVVMEYQIKKWNIKMQADVPETSFTLQGNADKLQQVFINLMANAHHAMPDGGGITIGLRNEERNGTACVIASVADTGCGIPQENLDKLFESFFSSEKGMNNLGLGLSITKQIVDDHHGEISVESEVGTGTTFSIILPVEQPEVVEEDTPSTS